MGFADPEEAFCEACQEQGCALKQTSKAEKAVDEAWERNRGSG